MNDQHDFERLVADSVRSIGPVAPSGGAHELTSSRVRRNRQQPEWLALIKEPPMRTNSQIAVGSPTARLAAILATTLSLAVALAVAGVGARQLLAANGPIVVAADGTGDFATITEGVAEAEDGDTVQVRPGTYIEAIVIESDITLEGDGEREDIVIQAPSDGPVWDTKFSWIGEKPYAIVLTSPGASVSGLTLSGEDSRLFVDGGSASINGLLFDEVGMPPMGSGSPIARALIVTGGADADVQDNDFLGGNGINVFDYSIAQIEDNRFDIGGIYGDYGDGTTIRNNTFSGVAPMAIRFGEPAAVLVEGNEISDREVAINTVNGMGPAVIKANTISGSTMTAISADGSTGQVIDNVITDSNLGITWSGEDGLVANNDVSGGATGIIVGAGSSIIEGNTVSGTANRGMLVYPTAVTELSGNSVCGNMINLDIRDGAEVVDDGTNEVCEDAPAE